MSDRPHIPEPLPADESPLDAAPDEPLEIVFAEDAGTVPPAELAESTLPDGEPSGAADPEPGRGAMPGESDAPPVENCAAP